MNIKGLNVFWLYFYQFHLLQTTALYMKHHMHGSKDLTMSVSELVAQHKELKIEAALLQDEQESSQSPEKLKDISTRMSSIGAELDMIQTILIALGAGALIASVSDDDDDDMTSVAPPADTLAPVINILGDNPANVEFGSTYVDAGATADQGQAITVTSLVLLIHLLRVLIQSHTALLMLQEIHLQLQEPL